MYNILKLLNKKAYVVFFTKHAIHLWATDFYYG